MTTPQMDALDDARNAKKRAKTGRRDRSNEAQVRISADALARLDEQCDRLMLGRNLVLDRAVENMADWLATRPDPLADWPKPMPPRQIPPPRIDHDPKPTPEAG